MKINIYSSKLASLDKAKLSAFMAEYSKENANRPAVINTRRGISYHIAEDTDGRILGIAAMKNTVAEKELTATMTILKTYIPSLVKSLAMRADEAAKKAGAETLVIILNSDTARLRAKIIQFAVNLPNFLR